MDDYFLFNDLIEYKLLSGLNYDDLNNKKKSEKYNNRINTWFKFLNICKTNKKNLVIFINGPSNSGKYSWSIELAKRLNIKNVIQTDTIRNNIRKLRNNNKNSIIHKSSYKCWEQYTKSYSKKSQIKGFESQSRIIAPYINQLILESCNNGQFAIIEGIHLVPWIINKQKFKVIDARNKERFDGKVQEPRKGLRSGNIKNSFCIPFNQCLNEDKTFKTKEDLKLIFETCLENINEKNIVFSCGSGVTACVLALAYSLINDKYQPCIYDGSWAEYGII